MLLKLVLASSSSLYTIHNICIKNIFQSTVHSFITYTSYNNTFVSKIIILIYCKLTFVSLGVQFVSAPISIISIPCHCAGIQHPSVLQIIISVTATRHSHLVLKVSILTRSVLDLMYRLRFNILVYNYTKIREFLKERTSQDRSHE